MWGIRMYNDFYRVFLAGTTHTLPLPVWFVDKDIHIIIIIIKRISGVPIYCTNGSTGLFTNTNNTRTHARTHAHTHTQRRVGQGDRNSCGKGSLKIVIEQVHLEGSFKRGGRIKVAECLMYAFILNCTTSQGPFLLSKVIADDKIKSKASWRGCGVFVICTIACALQACFWSLWPLLASRYKW